MMNATLRGKPDAGNPHVRFDEGEVVSANPRRASLLYKKLIVMAAVVCAAVSAQAVKITWSASDVEQEYGGPATGSVMVYYKLQSASAWTSPTSCPLMSGGSFSWESNINLTSGNKYEAYYTIDETSTSYFKSATTQFTPTGSGPTARYSVDLGNSGTWTSPEPTPEPTSGLLMLLGMGMLALKRKRA